MTFLEKIFTQNPHKMPSNKAAFEFINNSQKDCEKWFENEAPSLSKEIGSKAVNYIEQFGLEKHSKSFELLPELKNAIAGYFQKCKIKCEAKNIIVRVGIFEILQDLYRVADFYTDEKILFALPISGYFAQQCHDNEIAIEFLNTDAKNGWKIDFANLESMLKKHSIKILFLNYPNGTNGTTLSQNDVLSLVAIVKKYQNLLVVVDESMRELFSHNGEQPLSLAAIHDISAQTITISNLKCYGLDNLDIAFACLQNKAIIAGLFSQQINVSYANQHIAIGALRASEDSKKHLAEIIDQCRQNSSLIKEELKTINENLSQKFGKDDEFVKSVSDTSQANNSILLQFSGLKGSKTEIGNKTLETDLDVVEFLKAETGIAMMPGQCCSLPEEEMILRLYLLKSKQELKAGFKKIGQALSHLKMLSKNISVTRSSKLSSPEKNHGR